MGCSGVTSCSSQALKWKIRFLVRRRLCGVVLISHVCCADAPTCPGVVSNVTDGLLDSPVSGLMGLAFQSIASSGATPLWQSLVRTNGTLDAPLMAFQLTRYVNDSSVRTVEYGGTFTVGSTNTSLYTGDIDYHDIPSGSVGYWSIPLSSTYPSLDQDQILVTLCEAISVQSMTLNLSASGSRLAAVDTGTTLVGGPPQLIQQMYATIPGSEPGTGHYNGYYTYREHLGHWHTHALTFPFQRAPPISPYRCHSEIAAYRGLSRPQILGSLSLMPIPVSARSSCWVKARAATRQTG